MQTPSTTSGLTDTEKKEKIALEKKLSEMEEELKVDIDFFCFKKIVLHHLILKKNSTFSKTGVLYTMYYNFFLSLSLPKAASAFRELDRPGIHF